MQHSFFKRWKYLIMALLLAIPLIIFISIKPSNQRDWSSDQTTLSHANIEGTQLHIQNIRNNTYQSPSDYTVAYYDKHYNLDNLESVWYVCEPFSTWRGLAHTFLSFQFKNNEYLSISVEIRKEKGESFSPIKGLLKQFEIMYVIGDEKDLIKLRSNYRKDEVFLYPLTFKKEMSKKLLIAMLEKTNELYQQPEFYHTLTNTCLTTIAHHINQIQPGKIPFNFSLLFPGYSDDYFFHLGFIDTDKTFLEYRDFHKINSRAEKYATDPAFSIYIRQFNASPTHTP